MDVAALRRVLFDLAGTVRFPDVSGLDATDWERLDRMARHSLLRPLLHAQHRGDSRIPAAIAARWQTAHREAALIALAREAELQDCVRLLEGAGFQPVALKGAWLARHAYPEPAQRAMLDVDLLLDPASVIPAWERLKAAGFVQAAEAEMPLADIVRLDKHLPPLAGPHGTLFELHHRLWERQGRLDHDAPQARDEAVRQRAIVVDGVRYPCAADMLAHLIVHAAYSHRLDCGPRVLADIDMLLRREAIDWAAFWAGAAREGWRDGARLLLDLVSESRAGVSIDFAADHGKPAPLQVRADAVQLLFPEPGQRASARFAAGVIKGGLGSLADKVRGRRGAAGETPVTRDMTRDGGRGGWMASRLARVAGDLAERDTRRQAQALARLSRWFDA